MQFIIQYLPIALIVVQVNKPINNVSQFKGTSQSLKLASSYVTDFNNPSILSIFYFYSLLSTPNYSKKISDSDIILKTNKFQKIQSKIERLN